MNSRFHSILGTQPLRNPLGSWPLGVFLVLFAMVLASPVRGQDHTVLFNVSDPGVSKAITTWGLDTAWLDGNNVRRGVIYMGKPQVDVIRFSFTGDTPVSGGNLTGSGLTEFNDRMTIVNNYADSHTALYLNNDTESLDPSYVGVNGVNPATWAQLIDVTRQKCEAAGRTVLSVAPFNEPDYGTWQGDVNRLGDVCWQLRNTYGANFSGIRLCGGSTLNCDQAIPWYSTLNGWGYLEEGNTHQLAGSFDNYASFYQLIESNGDVGANDELHNVMEAMVGAEYGMDTGIWWGTAERARGEFVKASDGQRLGYAEDRPKWTAASVYRAPSGAVQAFVGESERQALPTTYRFFSKDRDVFYDGDGPRRDYTVTTTGGPGYQTAAHHNAERVVNITWGADVQPVIGGRYYVVSRNSLKVMEVASASTADGANIQQNAFNGGLHQQWDINPMPSVSGGDYSYFSVTAAHSGKAADLYNFSYDDGGDIKQWGLPGSYPGVNQQWFLEYVGDGWFYIRNRWSGKYLDVNGASTANGANIQQWTGTGSLNQQWRLIPVGASPTDVIAPPTIAGVNATANPRSVRLTWNASPVPDLGGYTVLRSTTSGGPYNIVARGLTTPTFTDKSANLPMTYYYVVKAVDKSWNSSGNSLQVSATPSGSTALLARYPFDGNANDSSANANHPIVITGSPAFVPGKFGSAMDLDGTSQYTMLPANMLVGVSNFTVAVWVNWDGGAAWQRIFDFGNDTTQYMFLTPSSGGGTLHFGITTNNYWNEQVLDTAPLTVGQWTHVAVTRDGNTAKLYVNGVVMDTETVTISPASFNPVLNYLGDSQFEGDPLFNGRLDDLRIYNYALSATEVGVLQTGAPAVPAGLSAVAGDGEVRLTWNAAFDAESYNVKRSYFSGGPYTTIAANVTGLSYTNTGLANGTTYHYVVSSSNSVSGVQSANSTQVSASPAFATPPNIGERIYALTTENKLISFNSTDPGTILTAYTVSGLQANEKIVGIDFWNGTLYGLGDQSHLYTLNVANGAAGFVGSFIPVMNGEAFGFEAEPGGLRLVSNLDQNLLLNYSTGGATVGPTINGSPNPAITGLAYHPGNGQLYSADYSQNTIGLLNTGSGLVSTIGQAGIDFSRHNGFDISPNPGNRAYLASPAASSGFAANLYTVDLTTGSVAFVGLIGLDGDNTLIRGLSVKPGYVELTSTNLMATVDGGQMTLSWPEDHTGWRLEVQTNSLDVGLSTNWVTVPGSTDTNRMVIPMTSEGAACVLYRLVYP